MIKIIFPISFLLCCSVALAQPYEAFTNFDSALTYKRSLFESTFDSTWQQIPTNVSLLSALKTVIFDHSQISEISQEVYSLPKLNEIVLIGTNFLDVGVFLECISKSSISVVVIQEVGLPTLPKLHSPANRLKELHLIDVGLESLSDGFLDFPNLEHLSIVGNEEVVFGTDEGLSNLKVLDLSESQWQALPVAASSLPNLQALIIMDNTRLNIDSTIHQLNENASLKVLNLDGCGIVNVPVALCEQKSMELLSMRGNSIAALPQCLASMESLTRIDLNNKFR